MLGADLGADLLRTTLQALAAPAQRLEDRLWARREATLQDGEREPDAVTPAPFALGRETLGAAHRGPRARTASPRSGSQFDYSYAQDVPADDSPGEGGVAVGTMVRHPVFGRGQVLAVIGSDLNQKLRIKFERAGVKTVMVRFANLELA